jgi:hypothetical protein
MPDQVLPCLLSAWVVMRQDGNKNQFIKNYTAQILSYNMYTKLSNLMQQKSRQN